MTASRISGKAVIRIGQLRQPNIFVGDCLLPNDPAIKSYQLHSAPNVIIEQRNR
jgi:hypothetical protein